MPILPIVGQCPKCGGIVYSDSREKDPDKTCLTCGWVDYKGEPLPYNSPKSKGRWR